MRVSAVVLLLCAFLALTSAADTICTSGACGTPTCTGASKTAVNDKAEFQPVLSNVAAAFENNRIKVTIVGDLVGNREYTELFATNAKATCQLKSNPAFFSSLTRLADANTCKDTFVFDLPWASHVDCGFTVSQDTDSTLEFHSELTLLYTDKFKVTVDGADVDLARTYSVPFSLFVQFPKKLDISTTFNVSSVVTKGWAITSDIYNPVSKTLSLEITTLVDWPNMLRNDGGSFTNADIVVVDSATGDVIPSGLPVIDYDFCDAADPTKPCTQHINVDIKKIEAADQCTFDGVYTLKLELYTCRSADDYESCTHHEFVAVMSIADSNVCGKVTATAEITGSLKPNHAGNYLLGTTGSFSTDLTTHDNTVDVTFQSISFYDNVMHETKFLYQNGANVAGVEKANLKVFNGLSTVARFEVDFHSSVFKVEPSGSHQITFFATIGLHYADNRRRTVTAAIGPDTLKTSVKFGLESDVPAASVAPVTPGGYNVALIAGIAGGVAGVALLTIGVALLVRRYRSKDAPLVNNSA